jgi:transcription antitermination factor NusG
MTANISRARKPLQPGTDVVILDGPLEGVPATVIAVDDDDFMVTVLVRLRDEPLLVDVPTVGVNTDVTRVEHMLQH